MFHRSIPDMKPKAVTDLKQLSLVSYLYPLSSFVDF